MVEILKAGLMIFVCFLALYLLVLLVVWMGQERFIFQPTRLPQNFTFSFRAEVRECAIATADGQTLSGLYFSTPKPTQGAVLYFHGNRGDLSRWGDMHAPFTQRGYDVLIIDYRGYGKSTGTPSEKGLYQDAEAALEWLLQHHAQEDILFYGRSLGSGVAAYLATQHSPKALLLETPYDAMPSVIQHQVLLPLPGRIFRHNFPTHHYLKRVECPVYVFAGSQDQLIPLQLSRRLQPLLRNPAHFILIEGAGHRNISDFKVYEFQLDRLLLP